MEFYVLLTIFVTSFIVALSGAMMPGPLLAVTITESARRGARSGFLFIVGHAALEFILFIGFTLGLQVVLRNSVVIRVVGIFGGLFLFWMAYGMLRDSHESDRFSLQPDAKSKAPKLNPFFSGIAISLAHPYWILWWATVGAKFVLESLKYGNIGLSFFYAGHILSDFVWYSIVILAVVSGKKFVSDKIYRYMIIGCAVFLMILAIFFIFDLKVF